jgi:hypothetical protein
MKQIVVELWGLWQASSNVQMGSQHKGYPGASGADIIIETGSPVYFNEPFHREWIAMPRVNGFYF